MLDDPKNIGGLMVFFYYVLGFLIMALPVFAPVGLLVSFFCPAKLFRKQRFASACFLVTGYVLLCMLVIVIFAADPYDVLEWYMD